MSDAWTTRSSPQRQIGAGVAMLVVGICVMGVTHRGLPGDWTAFAFGTLLAVVGLGALLFGKHETVTVDARAKRILVERRSLLGGRSEEEIRFADIAEVQLASLGDDEGGSTRHFVELTLRDRRKVSLFHGFVDGAHDRSAMEARAQRLRGDLGLVA